MFWRFREQGSGPHGLGQCGVLSSAGLAWSSFWALWHQTSGQKANELLVQVSFCSETSEYC